MDYRELSPPPDLAGRIRCIWMLTGSAVDREQGASIDQDLQTAPSHDADPVFPDGSPEIIVNFADPFRARKPDGAFVAQPALMLVGQITGPFVVQPTGDIHLVGIRLEPYGGAALYHDMSAITNDWIDLAERYPDLKATVSNVTNDDGESVEGERNRHRSARDASVERLLRILTPYLSRHDVPHATVIEACRMIRDHRGNIVLDQLAERLDTTPRTLQRRFAREVGIAPKLLARITRFQHVFTAWRADPRTLASVAADCGYFDQSHLVRDFRDFAGEAPAATLAEQARFTALFLP